MDKKPFNIPNGLRTEVTQDVFDFLSNNLSLEHKGTVVSLNGNKYSWNGVEFDHEQVKYYLKLNEGEPDLVFNILGGGFGNTASGSAFWSIRSNSFMRFSKDIDGHGQYLVLPLENTNKQFIIGSLKDDVDLENINNKLNWNYSWLVSMNGENVRIKQHSRSKALNIIIPKTSSIKLIFNGVKNKTELYVDNILKSETIDTYQYTQFDIGCKGKNTLVNYPSVGKEIMQNPSGTNPDANLPYSPQKHIYFDSLDNYVLLNNENGGLNNIVNLTFNWSVSFVCRSEFKLDRSNIVFCNGSNWIGIRPKSTGTQFIFGNGVDRQIIETNFYVKKMDSIVFTFNSSDKELSIYVNSLLIDSSVLRIANGSSGDCGIGGLESIPFYSEMCGGGIDEYFVLNKCLLQEEIEEYDSSRVVSSLSYYDEILEYWSLGEDAFPLVKGVKGIVDGVLMNGLVKDFKEN